MSARKKRIGLVVESLSNRFWGEVVKAVAREAEQSQLQLLTFVGGKLHASNASERLRNDCYRLPHDSGLDGVLLTPLGDQAGPERLQAFFSELEHLPRAALATVVQGVPSVCTDNLRGMCDAVQHLISRHGAVRIAFLQGPENNQEAELRYQGFTIAMAEAGLAIETDLIVDGDFTWESGAQAIEQLSEAGQLGFDALVAANDSMALGAIHKLSEFGLQVGEHLAVVSFDDVPEARWGKPSLSTVRQSFGELAREAIAQLLQRMEGAPGSPLTLVPSRFIARESCGCRRVAGAFESPSVLDRASEAPHEIVERLSSRMKDLALAGRERLDEDWSARLSRSVAWQLEEDRGQFLPILDDLLHEVSRSRQELGDWQRAVSGLRSQLTAAERRKMEETLLRARVLVGEAAERQQAVLRLRSEHRLGQGLRGGNRILGSFSEQRLFEALAEHLSALDVRDAYVVCYSHEGEPEPPVAASLGRGVQEAPGQAALRSAVLGHVVFALRAGVAQWTPATGDALSMVDIVATTVGHATAGGPGPSFSLLPLLLGTRRIGLLLLGWSAPAGEVCDWLAEQLSAALEGTRLLRLVEQAAERRADVRAERMKQELSIAARVQQAVLPSSFGVSGLQVAAVMQAATEVGGDFYDVFEQGSKAWLCVGDVAGHGLGPGVVMMNLHSSLRAAVHCTPGGEPEQALALANQVMFESVRGRLGSDEHATVTLLCHVGGGRCVFAGAHEDLLIYRAQSNRVEAVASPGIWLGILPDASQALIRSELQLEADDVLLLYTDGVVEAMNGEREQFGLERLESCLLERGREPVEAICQGLLATVSEWAAELKDDVTLLVARKEPVPQAR